MGAPWSPATTQLTIHKVGQVDLEAALFGIGIRKDPVIWKRPAECVGDYDDDALGCRAIWRLAHVRVESVVLDDLAFGFALVDWPRKQSGHDMVYGCRVAVCELASAAS